MPKHLDDEFVITCLVQRAWYDKDGEVDELKDVEPDDAIDGLSGIVDLLTEYVSGVQEHEDEAGKNGDTPKQRVEDFIKFLQVRVRDM